MKALPDTTYIPAVFDADVASRLFQSATQLPFPTRNRGITPVRKVCAFNLDDSTTADDMGDTLTSLVAEMPKRLQCASC